MGWSWAGRGLVSVSHWLVTPWSWVGHGSVSVGHGLAMGWSGVGPASKHGRSDGAMRGGGRREGGRRRERKEGWRREERGGAPQTPFTPDCTPFSPQAYFLLALLHHVCCNPLQPTSSAPLSLRLSCLPLPPPPPPTPPLTSASPRPPRAIPSRAQLMSDPLRPTQEQPMTNA